ncbi:UNVERIFIED_ORG: hypothetical protein GGD59_002206 [Rhizobium esperanzae]
MSTMIERVARALDPYAWSEKGFSIRREVSKQQARAAIAAMREPTDGMHEAAENIAVYYDDFSCGDGNITLGLPGYHAKFNGVWSKLIDAALKEEA